MVVLGATLSPNYNRYTMNEPKTLLNLISCPIYSATHRLLRCLSRGAAVREDVVSQSGRRASLAAVSL